jgi:hypothetical protein
VISFDQISPISPLDTSTSSSIDDSDTEQGGAPLPDSNISQPSVQIVEPERERVVDRSGRRVTPRALSYNTDFGTQEDENDVFVDAPETLEASPITPPVSKMNSGLQDRRNPCDRSLHPVTMLQRRLPP